MLYYNTSKLDEGGQGIAGGLEGFRIKNGGYFDS
jgi:hypothetical protein